MSKKIILHLCADIGSDSLFYANSDEYEVIKIGKDIGVENYATTMKIHGIIANPPCQNFSIARGFDKVGDLDEGMVLVNACLRIIKECNPVWWILENPATGKLKDIIGKPVYTYQPWEYGSPWTKKTALWGNFNIPPKRFTNWNQIRQNPNLYIRPGRSKPGLVYFHKSAIEYIPEMQWAREYIKEDADIRSMCSQGFAFDFFEHNKQSMETRKKAKYCGETIRKIYNYMNYTATHIEESENYNISEDYLVEIFGFMENLLLENDGEIY